MIEFIKKTLVELYRTCTTDEFGQVGKFNFTPNVFGEKAKEVEKYCKNNQGILRFCTYGGRYGTYRGFSIESHEILSACRDAIKTNPNYIHNMTRW